MNNTVNFYDAISDYDIGYIPDKPEDMRLRIQSGIDYFYAADDIALCKKILVTAVNNLCYDPSSQILDEAEQAVYRDARKTRVLMSINDMSQDDMDDFVEKYLFFPFIDYREFHDQPLLYTERNEIKVNQIVLDKVTKQLIQFDSDYAPIAKDIVALMDPLHNIKDISAVSVGEIAIWLWWKYSSHRTDRGVILSQCLKDIDGAASIVNSFEFQPSNLFATLREKSMEANNKIDSHKHLKYCEIVAESLMRMDNREGFFANEVAPTVRMISKALDATEYFSYAKNGYCQFIGGEKRDIFSDNILADILIEDGRKNVPPFVYEIEDKDFSLLDIENGFSLMTDEKQKGNEPFEHGVKFTDRIAKEPMKISVLAEVLSGHLLNRIDSPSHARHNCRYYEDSSKPHGILRNAPLGYPDAVAEYGGEFILTIEVSTKSDKTSKFEEDTNTSDEAHSRSRYVDDLNAAVKHCKKYNPEITDNTGNTDIPRFVLVISKSIPTASPDAMWRILHSACNDDEPTIIPISFGMMVELLPNINSNNQEGPGKISREDLHKFFTTIQECLQSIKDEFDRGVAAPFIEQGNVKDLSDEKLFKDKGILNIIAPPERGGRNE